MYREVMASNGETPDYCADVEAETSFDVQLYIYDLARGLRKSLNEVLSGKELPTIWHTGIVAYGREYFFLSPGVESCRPGGTILGEPDQILTLGKTELPYSVFLEYIFGLGESNYRPGCYDFQNHNCNTFTQEVAVFLTGKPIPEDFRDIPSEILKPPLGDSLKEYFKKLNLRVEGSKGLSFGDTARQVERTNREQERVDSASASGTVQNGVNQEMAEQANAAELPKTETPKLKQEKPPETPQVNGHSENETSMEKNSQTVSDQVQQQSEISEAAAPSKEEENEISGNAEIAKSLTPTENAEATALSSENTRNASVSTPDTPDDAVAPAPFVSTRKSRRYEDPPIVFQDVNGNEAINKLNEMIGNHLGEEEKQCLKDLQEYLSTDGGAWALGSNHLDLMGRLLNDKNFSAEIPVITLHMMQAAALKDDVILLLHQDRKDHHIMSYLYKIETLTPEEQEEIAKLMCNLCFHPNTFDWLMYISEWQEGGYPCNNNKVTVRVAVHTLLSDPPGLQDKGAALMYNLALKELFDDTATELATAILQYLHGDIKEETAFWCLTALLRFIYISYNDVPALVKMLGPDLKKFLKTSERVDEVLQQIFFKLNISMPA